MATGFYDRTSDTPHLMVFRRPWWARAFIVFAAGLAVVAAVGTLLTYGVSGGSVFLALWCVCVGLLFFWLAGPADVYFDLDQKTYRLVKGWLLFPKIRLGPWTDLWGIYVGQSSPYPANFCVGVTWWVGGGSVVLNSFGNRALAEVFAAEMISNLELKRVIPPRHLR